MGRGMSSPNDTPIQMHGIGLPMPGDPGSQQLPLPPHDVERHGVATSSQVRLACAFGITHI